jgi:hypothetical protein
MHIKTVQPNISQHEKFLPVIRRTISEANPAKILEDFKRCAGTEIRKYGDVERKKICTLDEATQKNLFPAEKRGIGFTHFEKRNLDCFNAEGNDVFAYQIERSGNGALVYELVLYFDGGTRREKVSMELLMALRSGAEDGFERHRRLIEKILSEDTPTFEIDIEGIRGIFPLFEPVFDSSTKTIWHEITNRLEWVLHERGYQLKQIGTPFEHALIADAVCAYGDGGLYREGVVDFSRQHIPLSILRKILSVQETAIARELRVVRSSFPTHYGLKTEDKMPLPISLEPIGNDGKTLWLPMAIDKRKLADALRRLPAELAFRDCALPDAKLDIGAVEEYVTNAFKR